MEHVREAGLDGVVLKSTGVAVGGAVGEQGLATVLWNISLSTIMVLLAGCGESTPTDYCDPCFTEAIVYGRVLDAGGAPADGLKLEFQLSAAPCTDTTRVSHGGSGFGNPGTDGTGRYRSVVHSLVSPFIVACADVTANILGDPRWTTVTEAFPTALEFREEGTPLDSARFDIVVEARSGG